MTRAVRSHPGLEAAGRRFPAETEHIQKLILHSEDFSGLCDDLAVADAALILASRLPDAVREEREAEYRGLVESLSSEIRSALDSHKIVRIPTAQRANRK